MTLRICFVRSFLPHKAQHISSLVKVLGLYEPTQSQARITFKRYASTNPNETFIVKGWRKFALAVKTFMAGSKALYSDVKQMYEIRSKSGNYILGKSAPQKIALGKTSFPLSRQQLHFTVTTQRTLLKMFPTVALFFVPVLGYIVPLVAFMYPDKLLSTHFWTDDQIEDFRVRKLRQSETVFRELMANMQQNNHVEILKFFDALKNEIQAGRTNYSSLSESDYFSHQATAIHTGLLCRGWGLRSWLPIRSKQQQCLERHMRYLFICDWLLALEGGVDKLTDKDVIEMCSERRIGFSEASDVDALKKELNTWVSLTTSFQECPVSLMAYFPLMQYLSLTKSQT